MCAERVEKKNAKFQKRPSETRSKRDTGTLDTLGVRPVRDVVRR